MDAAWSGLRSDHCGGRAKLRALLGKPAGVGLDGPDPSGLFLVSVAKASPSASEQLQSARAWAVPPEPGRSIPLATQRRRRKRRSERREGAALSRFGRVNRLGRAALLRREEAEEEHQLPGRERAASGR